MESNRERVNMGLQPDKVFVRAVEIIRQELSRIGLSDSRWADSVARTTDVPVDFNAPSSWESLAERFEINPNTPDAISRLFDTRALQDSLQRLINSRSSEGGRAIVVDSAETEALSLQIQTLLGLLRYYSRKRQSRASRILAASHRRATQRWNVGPIQQSLVRVVEDRLVRSDEL